MRNKVLRRRAASLEPVPAIVGLAARCARLGAGDLVVAMFHRALDTRTMAAQLDALLEGVTPVSGSQVVAALSGSGELPPAALWVTFDDGYADFASIAWPLMRERGVVPTLFVPTGFIGTGREFWWERLGSSFEATEERGALRVASAPLSGLPLATRGQRVRAFRAAREAVKGLPHADAMALVEELVEELGAAPPAARVETLDWDDLRNLSAEGVEFGGHTRDHPMLDSVPIEVAREEIAAGIDDLRREVGEPLSAFAYPSGRYNPDVTQAVRDSGLACAVTTYEGIERTAHLDPYRLRRLRIGPYADGTAVRLRRLYAQRPFARGRRTPDRDPL